LFRHIIWDVDGTLFDTYPAMAKAFKAALNDLGQDAPAGWIEDLARQSVGHCLSTLAGTYQVPEEAIEQGFDKYYYSITPEEQPPFPGVIAVCRYICSGGGKNVIVTHRGQKGTLELLTAHRMTEYFAGWLTHQDGYPRKPDPAAFEAALQRYDLKRAETMAVGDRAIDILAGQAAGLFSCLFGPDTDGAAADLTVGSFDELYQFIAAQSREGKKQ
jgi:phosphoglycolate phosphatase-like HAD superfamily hydrolase